MKITLKHYFSESSNTTDIKYLCMCVCVCMCAYVCVHACMRVCPHVCFLEQETLLALLQFTQLLNGDLVSTWKANSKLSLSCLAV